MRRDITPRQSECTPASCPCHPARTNRCGRSLRDVPIGLISPPRGPSRCRTPPAISARAVQFTLPEDWAHHATATDRGGVCDHLKAGPKLISKQAPAVRKDLQGTGIRKKPETAKGGRQECHRSEMP